MSLRNFRHRFKADKDERKDGNKYQGDGEHCFEMVDPLDDPPLELPPMEKAKIPDENDSDQRAEASSPALGSEIKDKSIFEIQLTELQEQLLAVMIENQTLKSELNCSKTKTELERVKSELLYERQRCDVLEKKLDTAAKKGSKSSRSSPDPGSRNRLSPPGGSSLQSTPGSSGQGSPTPSIGDSAGTPKEEKEEELPLVKPRSFSDRIKEYIYEAFYSFMDDFSEMPSVDQEMDPDGEPLAVKTLKENLKRFGGEAKPYLSTVKGVSELLAWQSPPYTLIVYLVYMYSVWKGWFLPFFLFCLTFRFFINYLRYRGWSIHFNFFDTVEEDKETEDKDMGVSDKFNLVLHVARKVQNVLGEVADSLEKIKSLVTWRHPLASRQLFLALFAAFIVSCLLPVDQIFFYGGLYLGVKLFIIDHIYRRFPRVKQKYDTAARTWQELPTDLEYERRYVKSEMDKYILPYSLDKGDNLVVDGERLSLDDKSFCELFSLPDSECPLPGWRGGRRCTLINREKSLTAAFKNGKLYLTHSFLCFERTKTPSPKNIVIPLADIVRLEKAKPYSWIPGGGMAIEIAVVGSDKPFVFGAIINRDEVYENLLSSGRKVEMAWAASVPGTSASQKSEMTD